MTHTQSFSPHRHASWSGQDYLNSVMLQKNWLKCPSFPAGSKTFDVPKLPSHATGLICPCHYQPFGHLRYHPLISLGIHCGCMPFRRSHGKLHTLNRPMAPSASTLHCHRYCILCSWSVRAWGSLRLFALCSHTHVNNLVKHILLGNGLIMRNGIYNTLRKQFRLQPKKGSVVPRLHSGGSMENPFLCWGLFFFFFFPHVYILSSPEQ